MRLSLLFRKRPKLIMPPLYTTSQCKKNCHLGSTGNSYDGTISNYYSLDLEQHSLSKRWTWLCWMIDVQSHPLSRFIFMVASLKNSNIDFLHLIFPLVFWYCCHSCEALLFWHQKNVINLCECRMFYARIIITWIPF
jgi:hypothetical protein